jgi:dimethylargininase
MITINSQLIAPEKSFNNAIVRLPCPEMIHGLTSSDQGIPDYQKALRQHLKYVETLKYCGLNVKILDYDDHFPDSTFIEDVAVCTKKCALITSPGAPSRRGEIKGIRPILSIFFNDLEEITVPGKLDGGDVMMVDDHFFIGVSRRTNDNGADQLIYILKNYGYTGSKISLERILHLKSGASYLENDNLLVTGELIGRQEFAGLNRLVVPDYESYAANSVWINGKVIVPDGFPETRNQIEKAGYETIILDVSEFRKLDGGLSCLSLRF